MKSKYLIYCCFVAFISCQSGNKKEIQSVTKPKSVVVEQKAIQDDKSETILNKSLKVFIPSDFALMDEATLKVVIFSFGLLIGGGILMSYLYSLH